MSSRDRKSCGGRLATHCLPRQDNRIAGRLSHTGQCGVKVRELAETYDMPALNDRFAIAEGFHKIFYHGWVEDYELEFDVPKVHWLVHQLLGLQKLASTRK